MSDEGSSNTKANLARIRDNQRRSRARRKEYLQELETKYRTCETLGVEATAEIQTAARRVLEENKRLRNLLRQQGLSDEQIDVQLQPSQSLAAGLRDGTRPDASSGLEQMLATRRQCKPDGCSDRGSSCGPNIPNQPLQPALSTRSLSATTQQLEMDVHHLANLTPSSSNMSVPTPPNASYQSRPFDNDYHGQEQLAYEFPTQVDQFTRWQDPSPTGGHQRQSSMSQDTSMQRGTFTDDQTWQDNETWQNPNASSCRVAASIISTMNSNVGHEEVARAIGCANGRECAVDNSVVFDLMDRYAQQS